MYKKPVLLLLFFLLVSPLTAVQDLPDVLTVKKAVKHMQETFVSVKTYRAQFKIRVEEGKQKRTMEGEMKYQTPSRIIFFFENPKEQIIYSDGRILKIYLPALKVVGEQKLEEKDQDLMFINSKTSFYQLTRQYNFFFPEEYIRQKEGQKFYILHLKQKNVYSGFKTIDLWVTEDWMIVKVQGITRDGKKITVNFFDIEINRDMTENEFDFNLPVDVQTIYNPIFTFQEK